MSATTPLVIANPRADRGRTGRRLGALLDALRSSLGELDVVCTRRPGDAVVLAMGAASARRPLIISVGGDGTLSEIVDGLLRGEEPPPAAILPALGIVAAGTGGDFGRCLGIPTDLPGCLATIAAGAQRTIDVGWARFVLRSGGSVRRAWVNVLSAGIGGLVDEFAAAAPIFLPRGVTYAQATLRAIVTCRREPLRMRAVLPDGSVDERVIDPFAVAICNGTTFGAGMHIAPMARPDDGLLEVIVFETPTKVLLARRFRTIYAGTHLEQPGVRHFSCRSLAVQALPSADGLPPHTRLPTAPPRGRMRGCVFPLDVDGDALGDLPLEVGVMPAALRVCAPLAPVSTR